MVCSVFGAFGTGWACGCGTACCLPFSIFVAGGFAVGKYLFAAHVQPSSTSALSITARIRFLLSFTVFRSLRFSRYWVVALAAPRMATADSLERHPCAPRGPIALDCGDRIGRTARLVAAARRE